MKKVSLTLVLILIFLFTGCTGQEPRVVDMPKPIKPSHEQTAQYAPTQTEIKEVSSQSIGYDYNPVGKRDPFKSLIVIKEEKEKKSGVSPFEQEISSFRLVGVVWDGKEYFASITLPDGKSYTVKKGMRLGLEGGIVHEITKDSVIVRQYEKHKKELKPKDIILRLRMEE